MSTKKAKDDREVVIPLQSGTGSLLDPVDGQPVFTDGMSRRRWLAANKDQRKADFIAELRAEPELDEFARGAE